MLNAWKDVYVSKQALCIVSRHRSITIFLFCIKLNDSDVALTAPTSAFWRNIHSLFMLILLFIAILLNLYPNNYVFFITKYSYVLLFVSSNLGNVLHNLLFLQCIFEEFPCQQNREYIYSKT